MLPFGVRAFEGFEPNDLVLYVETRRAVVVGDTLIDRGNGLEVHREWPGQGVAAEEVVHRLRPLLDLREEYSTFSWVLEPMLERAGFEIRDVSYDPSRIYAAYVCAKRSPEDPSN